MLGCNEVVSGHYNSKNPIAKLVANRPIFHSVMGLHANFFFLKELWCSHFGNPSCDLKKKLTISMQPSQIIIGYIIREEVVILHKFKPYCEF
jgi:hypothetical protein